MWRKCFINKSKRNLPLCEGEIKMEWIIGFVVIAFLIVVFVVLQLIGILFLLEENKKIAEELEKNSPPF
jgi:hypothetical protein